MENAPNANNSAAMEEAVRKDGMVSTTLRVLGKPVRMVCDPVVAVCYPALEKHWQDRYRKYWPDKFARRMLILDFTLLTIVASLIVMAAATYYILPLFPSISNVQVHVLSPSAIVGGQATSFAVSYVNDSAHEIGCTSLRIRLPEDAKLLTTLTPRVESENFCNVEEGSAHGTVLEEPSGTTLIYDVGNLEPHENGLVTFDAAVYAPVGTERSLAVELLYWEESHTTASRSRTVATWTAADAALRMTVTPPSSLIRGRAAPVVYELENASAVALPALTLRLERPSDFVMVGASLPGLRGDWTLPSLAAGEKTTFTVNGYFTEAPGVSAAPVLILSAYTKDGALERKLNEVRQNLDPKATGFVLSQELIGTSGGSALIPGTPVMVRVNYANNGTEALKDVTITLYTDGRYIERAEPAELTWSASSTPALAELAPGTSGTLEATLVIRRNPPVEQNAPSVFKISAAAAFYLAEDPKSVIKASTAVAEMPLTSRLGVEASALYYTKDGDQLGVGPLPPKVGQTTKYRVVLQIGNTSGAVEDAILEATLPLDVEWTDKVSVSDGEGIDWLPSSRTIHWRIGDLPAFAGSIGEYVGASFEVALTPAAEDAGTVPVLLTDIRLDGRDVQTGLNLHATASPVTTDLPFDVRAAGKGTVEAR